MASNQPDTKNDGDSSQSTCTLNIHWFRNDLRLHDNPALCHTIQLSLSSTNNNNCGIIPIFIFDNTRIYGSNIRSNLDSARKCGPRRAQFTLEAVSDLRRNLERCGSGLIIGVGEPESILAKIAARQENSSSSDTTSVDVTVVCQEEICSEELSVDNAVRSKLGSNGNKVTLCTVWGSRLYDPNTLPFEGGVRGVPDAFTPFRKEVEKSCMIGIPLDVPSNDQLKLHDNIHNILKGSGCSLDFMPTLIDLGYNTEDIESISKIDARSALPKGYCGGETFALSRVQEYIWDLDLLRTYFNTRNGMIGADYSTKFAPWLACGCVSPRYIARECARYEEKRVKNKSTYW